MTLSWDVRRLAMLRSIAPHRSFTRAAEDLAMTQPAVSRQLRALEREIGVTLVARGPRHVALTPAGAALLEQAQPLVAALDTVHRRIRAVHHDPRGGAVRVGAVPSALAGFVTDAIVALRARRPRLEVTLAEGWSAELVRRTASGDLDIAVVSASAPPPSMTSSTLVREALVAVLPEGHQLARHRELRLSDLIDEPWLVASEPGGRQTVLESCAQAGFVPKIVAGTGWDSAGRLIACGFGIALAPQSTGERLAATSSIVVRPLLDAPVRELVVIRPPRTGPTPVEDDLEQEMRAALSSSGH